MPPARFKASACYVSHHFEKSRMTLGAVLLLLISQAMFLASLFPACADFDSQLIDVTLLPTGFHCLIVSLSLANTSGPCRESKKNNFNIASSSPTSASFLSWSPWSRGLNDDLSFGPDEFDAQPAIIKDNKKIKTFFIMYTTPFLFRLMCICFEHFPDKPNSV